MWCSPVGNVKECLAPDILAHLVEQVGQAAEAARHPGIHRRMHLFSRARCTPANKLCGNWFVDDLQIYCHFTTQNSETALKTNDEKKTILALFSPFVRTVTVSAITIGEMEIWRRPDYLFKVAEMNGGII